jgi:hypothetical protein
MGQVGAAPVISGACIERLSPPKGSRYIGCTVEVRLFAEYSTIPVRPFIGSPRTPVEHGQRSDTTRYQNWSGRGTSLSDGVTVPASGGLQRALRRPLVDEALICAAGSTNESIAGEESE